MTDRSLDSKGLGCYPWCIISKILSRATDNAVAGRLRTTDLDLEHPSLNLQKKENRKNDIY